MSVLNSFVLHKVCCSFNSKNFACIAGAKVYFGLACFGFKNKEKVFQIQFYTLVAMG